MVSAQQPPRRLPASALAATVLVLCALVALAARSGLHGSLLGPRALAPNATTTHTTSLTRPRGSAGAAALAVPHWVGWAALGLLAAFLLALIVRHLPALGVKRRAEGHATAEEPGDGFSPAPQVVGEEEASALQKALRDAVMRSLEEIRNDPDARRAIIGAYRLMEAALASAGLERGPAEAPREYLARALASIDAGSDAPRRLTALFERARFDDAELDLSLRDRAVEALLELRRAL